MENKINTTKKGFYWKYLNIVQSFPPYNKLRKMELKLLSLVMYNWDLYRNLPKEMRGDLIFSVKNRKILADELGIKVSNLTTLIYELRQSGILIGDILNPNIGVKCSDTFNLNFTFNTTLPDE